MTPGPIEGGASSAPSSLAEARFADAYLQQKLLEPRVEDRALLRDHWDLVHAVGAEVLGLFADPRDYARKGPGRAVGTGEIFSDDLEENPARVAAALGEAIFFGLQPKTPLLLARPIAQQVRRNIAALIEKAESPELRAQTIEIIQAALPTRAGDPLGVAERQQLWEVALLSGPLDELERYRRLFDEQRVVDVARLLGEPSLPLRENLPLALRTALAAPRTEFENKLANTRLGTWLDAIRDTGRRIADSRQERNVAEVAQAMVWLELINRRLSEDPESRCRLLYVTGEVSLLRAGEKIEVDWPGARGFFTPLFLRHTRAFLDEERALGPRGGKVPSLGASLTVWLGNFRDEVDPGDARIGQAFQVELSAYLKRLIAVQETSDPEGPRKIGEAWRELVSHLAPLTPSRLDRLADAAKRQDGQLQKMFETIREEVKHELPVLLRNYLSSVAFSRYLLEFPGRPAPRDRPLLVLEKQTSPVTQFFGDANKLWCEQRPLTAEKFHAYREKIRLAHRKEPGAADYFVDLAGAWVLAAQGHWRSAAIMARLAIDTATPSNTPTPVQANGREACYLLAYCRRLTAVTENDLEAPAKLLLRARDMRAKEISNRDKRNRHDWQPDIVMERIDAESLGLRLIGAEFAFFGDDESKRLDAATELRRVAGAFETQLIQPIERNLQNYRDAEQNWSEEVPEDQPDTTYRSEVRRLLLRRAWHSIIGIELTLPAGDDPERRRLRRAWEKSLQAVGRPTLGPVHLVWRRDSAKVRWPKEALPPTGQGELISLCGQLLFGPPPEALVATTAEARLRGYRRALDDLADALAPKPDRSPSNAPHSPINLRRLLVHPFDARRYLGWIEAVRAASPAPQ